MGTDVAVGTVVDRAVEVGPEVADVDSEAAGAEVDVAATVAGIAVAVAVAGWGVEVAVAAAGGSVGPGTVVVATGVAADVDVGTAATVALAVEATGDSVDVAVAVGATASREVAVGATASREVAVGATASRGVAVGATVTSGVAAGVACGVVVGSGSGAAVSLISPVEICSAPLLHAATMMHATLRIMLSRNLCREGESTCEGYARFTPYRARRRGCSVDDFDLAADGDQFRDLSNHVVVNTDAAVGLVLANQIVAVGAMQRNLWRRAAEASQII